jgi:chemotaxis family two-component system sensor kinase Cph1
MNPLPTTTADELLERCAKEPIHVPGAVQPHGLLIALREPECVVTTASDNTTEWLGHDARRVLGAPIEDSIGVEAGALVREALGAESLADVNPLHLAIAGRKFDGILHRHAGATLLELEPTTEASGHPSPENVLGRIVTRLQTAATSGQLMRIATDELRRLTGFDRVLAYRFDDDDNGAVVAEARGEAMPSFLGHHFPASDIPRQARELYRVKWLRLIPDASYQPVPLVAADPAAPPLDLSLSELRSVSPVHREYMANMGVRASLTISLLPRGRLWGLITCHHGSPRSVPFDVRATCEIVGKLISLQLAALEDLDEDRSRAAQSDAVARVTAEMRNAQDETLRGLLADPEALLRLVNAGGAAVVVDEEIHLAGATPSPAEVRVLVEWLRARGESSVFSSRSLAAIHPPAARYAAVASGVLTLALPRPSQPHVLWFRPEEIETLSWGGNPNKAVELGTDGVRLHPRRSFDAWREEVRGRSVPWSRGELAAAVELRRTALELELGRQVRRAQAAVRARDDLVATVSHDMRNPIGVIQLQVEVLSQILDAQETERPRLPRSAVEGIRRATDRMTALVADLLDLERVEAGEVRLNVRECRIVSLIDDAVSLLAPLARPHRLTVTTTLGEDVRELWALADPDRIFQVLSNLIGNAIKFTPEGGKIEVGARREGGNVEIWVRDNGPGIPLADQARIFDRYWQAHGHGRTGSGLGLYIARGLVEAHGGKFRVQSAPGEGAMLTFSLPTRSPSGASP